MFPLSGYLNVIIMEILSINNYFFSKVKGKLFYGTL